MAQAYGRAALARALRVLPEEAIAESRRRRLVDPDPERDGVDRPTRRQRSCAARPKPPGRCRTCDRDRLAEARPRLDAQPQPAHDPHAALVEAGVEQVRVGDVLEPARDRVEAHPAVAHASAIPGLRTRSKTRPTPARRRAQPVGHGGRSRRSRGEVGYSATGRSWPMPSIIRRRAPGIALAVARPPAGRTSGSRVPWMTVVGNVEPSQGAGAVAGGGDRVQLAGDPGRRCGRGRRSGPAARAALLVERVAGRADQAEGLHRALDRRLAARAAASPAAAANARSSGRPVPAVAGGRHHRDQRAAPAPACSIAIVWAIIPPIEAPTTWARVDPEVVHQAERCRRPCRAAGRGRSRGGRASCRAASARRPSRSRRVADVAVVEADRRGSRARPSSAQKSSSQASHLRRQAHDQEQRLAGRVADLLVGELDPVGGRDQLAARRPLRGRRRRSLHHSGSSRPSQPR